MVDHGRPSFRELFERADPYQRERLLELVVALRELRREIEDHDLCESVHQSPRSSLRHFSGDDE